MRRQILSVLVFAIIFVNGRAWSQCPATIANPVLTATPVEGTRELSGTGTPLPAGCTGTITLSKHPPAVPPAAVPPPMPIEPDGSSGQVSSDGRFKVHFSDELQGDDFVRVVETLFPSTPPAAAVTASSGWVRVAFCSDELKNIAAPQLTSPIIEGQRVVTGTAGVPSLPGCTPQIRFEGDDGDLSLAVGSAVDSSTGAFSVPLASPLTAGTTITAREGFVTPTGTLSTRPRFSDPVEVQTCSAYMSGSPLPTVNGTLLDTTTLIAGQAGQPTLAGCTAKVRVWRYEFAQPATLLGEAAVANAAFITSTLAETLQVGQRIELQEVIINASGIVTDPPPSCDPLTPRTRCLEVHDSEPWGRLKAYFTGGLLLSQDQGSFSQSNLFLAFTLDKAWRLPDYYYGRHRLMPGVNTFFETRLTAIPVTSCTQPTGTTATSTASPCTTTPANPAIPATTQNLETFIATRKTARLDVGIYFPWTLINWAHHGTPNALFIAPLAKTGFDTPVSDVSQSQPANTVQGTVTPANPTNFYNFYTFGGRVGHYSLTSSAGEAPELVSYLDVGVGPFSNLETVVQNPKTPGQSGRQRLYRLSLEGILKVPKSPLIVGFSANVGQETAGLGKSTILRRAGDDLRFLFGTRFEVSKLVDYLGKHGL